MACTKQTLVERITEDTDLDRSQAGGTVETLLEIIKDTLSAGEDVMISGFGKFCVNEKKARKGRNPATDEEMTLPARRVVTFKLSAKLRDRLNGRS